MKPSVRTPLLNLHLWTGLISGLVLIFVAISGAGLVFRDKLERRMDPARFIVTPGAAKLPADELVARAVAAHPSAELESVRYYGDPTSPFLVYFKDKQFVHMNPYTGAVLGTRQRYGEGFGWIEGLHKYLVFEPSPTGENVNGCFAIAFAGIILTGFVLWWPATRRALKAALTLNSKLSGRPWHLNLHKTLGFYCGLVLLVCAVTGVPIAFDSVKASLYPLTFSAKLPLPAVAKTDAKFVGFEVIGQRLREITPGAQETYIPLPKNGLVASYVIAADAPHPNARSYAYFDGTSAQLLRHTPYQTAPTGYRAYYWMMSLHTALLGGWLVKFLLLGGVLAVPVLAYTGTASYLKRRAAAAARKQAAPAATPAVTATASTN